MRMRPSRVAAFIAGFLVLIGAVAFAAFGMRGDNSAAAFLPAPYTISDTLVVHAKTVDGVTTYSGNFPLQSQCGTISTGIASPESGSPRITLLFTVLEPADGCAVPGTAVQEFSASYMPKSKETVPAFEGVTINGVIAKYQLVEEE